MNESVQQNYNIYPGRGYAGGIARTDEPTVTQRGIIKLDAGITVRPGIGLTYDRSDQTYIPAVAGTVADIVGMLGYNISQVQNVDDQVVFANGDEIRVNLMGTFWAAAHEAIEEHDRLVFNPGSGQWAVLAAAEGPAAGNVTLNAAYNQTVRNGISAGSRLPVVAASRATTAGEIFEVRLGWGYMG